MIKKGIMTNLAGMAFSGRMSGKIFDLTGSYHFVFRNGIACNLINLTISGWLFWRISALNRNFA